MNEFSDYESLCFIVDRIKNDNDQRAFEFFHKRFEPYLAKVINIKKKHPALVRYFASGLEPQDLIQDIFIKLIKLIDRLDLSEKSENEAEKIVKTWLGSIANKHILKVTASHKKKYLIDRLSTDEMAERLLDELVETAYNEQTGLVEYEKMEEILQSHFTNREREILFAYTNEKYLDPKRRMLSPQLQELAQRHNTTVANVKQINHRSLKKLKSILESS